MRGAPQSSEMLQPAARTDPRFWISRLIRRSYTDAVKFVRGLEYSTRVEHAGTSFFFPLGSDDEERAAVRAAEIHSAVVSNGWEAVCNQFPREITVAVFWNWNPLACTYTTLYSMPVKSRPPRALRRPAARRGCRIIVIESEEGVRRAIGYWLDRQPGFHCAASFTTVREALGAPRGSHLVLVNRDLVERPGGDRLETISAARPDLPVLCFGVYEESNYIFHSVTGVPRGYLLHRRPPTLLFDPIRRLARRPESMPQRLAPEVERYFQSLFHPSDQDPKEQELSNLTSREHEILICLSKGFSDKQIADALKISFWTVHGHVKKVFEKLGVHSRTEAVIKFLQK